MSRLARRAIGEAVLGTFAPAGKEEFALLTLPGEPQPLCLPEGDLLGAIHELPQWGLGDVAETIARIDKVIAAVEIAVVL